MLILRYRFAPCSRDLNRLNSTTLSPIYSYYNAMIHGLQVIRSYHVEDMCSDVFLQLVDDNTRVKFLVLTIDRWAAMRFDFVSFIFLVLVTCSSLIVRIYQQSLSSADIALTLSFTLKLMILFQWTVR
jgi:ABC transporter transmembrane region